MDCMNLNPSIRTFCEVNKNDPRQCPMYANDCKYCIYDDWEYCGDNEGDTCLTRKDKSNGDG